METVMEFEDSCDSGYTSHSSCSYKCSSPVKKDGNNNIDREEVKQKTETAVVSPWTPIRPKRIHLNYIVVGDERIGKSTLVRNYACPGVQEVITKTTSNLYIPTTQESYSVKKKIFVGEEPGENPFAKVTVTICDTGGNEELDRLRPLFYNQAEVFIICFSVVIPSTFRNVKVRWLPELRRHVSEGDKENGNGGNRVVLLVGMQSDLRSNFNVLLHLAQMGECPIEESQAMKMACKMGAIGYVECSGATKMNLREVFELPLKAHMKARASDIASLYSENGSLFSQSSCNSSPESRRLKVTKAKLKTSTLGSDAILKQLQRADKKLVTRQKKQNKKSSIKKLLTFPCLFNN